MRAARSAGRYLNEIGVELFVALRSVAQVNRLYALAARICPADFAVPVGRRTEFPGFPIASETIVGRASIRIFERSAGRGDFPETLFGPR